MSEKEPAGAPEWPQWLGRQAEYMGHVIKVCSDSGALADLRSGNLPQYLDQPWRMMPHLTRQLPRPRSRDQERAHLAVAAWYAAQAPNPGQRRAAGLPAPWEPGQGNLGWSMAQAAQRGAFKTEAGTQRLALLCRSAEPDVLLRGARPVIAFLRSREIPVSWPLLLRDLERWPRWRGDVTREWMSAFYDPDWHTIDLPNNNGNNKEND